MYHFETLRLQEPPHYKYRNKEYLPIYKDWRQYFEREYKLDQINEPEYHIIIFLQKK